MSWSKNTEVLPSASAFAEESPQKPTANSMKWKSEDQIRLGLPDTKCSWPNLLDFACNKISQNSKPTSFSGILIFLFCFFRWYVMWHSNGLGKCCNIWRTIYILGQQRALYNVGNLAKLVFDRSKCKIRRSVQFCSISAQVLLALRHTENLEHWEILKFGRAVLEWTKG